MSYVIVGGCMFIGIGIGMLLGDVAPGALIGLGAGLILNYIWGEGKPGPKKKDNGND